jgi:hypothetical protein
MAAGRGGVEGRQGDQETGRGDDQRADDFESDAHPSIGEVPIEPRADRIVQQLVVFALQSGLDAVRTDGLQSVADLFEVRKQGRLARRINLLQLGRDFAVPVLHLEVLPSERHDH